MRSFALVILQPGSIVISAGKRIARDAAVGRCAQQQSVRGSRGLWIRPEPPVGAGVDEAKRAAILEDRAGGAVLGITGEPSDIPYAILYLASDAARFVTGQVLRPNGGVAMP